MHSFFLVEATKSEVQSQYTKPKMSYAQLIAEALLTGSERMLTLNDIYIAINKQHPYYSLDAASGRNWQNAIRLVELLENILSRFYTILAELIKGQLISKCPFGVIVLTKIPSKKFDKFCPTNSRAEFVKFFHTVKLTVKILSILWPSQKT